MLYGSLFSHLNLTFVPLSLAQRSNVVCQFPTQNLEGKWKYKMPSGKIREEKFVGRRKTPHNVADTKLVFFICFAFHQKI